jgi:hypothetical protein
MHTSVLYRWVVGGIGIQYACVINCALEVCHRFFSIQYIASLVLAGLCVHCLTVAPQFLLHRRVLGSNPGPAVIKNIMSPCSSSKNRGFGTILDEQNMGSAVIVCNYRINAAKKLVSSCSEPSQHPKESSYFIITDSGLLHYLHRLRFNTFISFSTYNPPRDKIASSCESQNSYTM